jgi:hypothetical protein
MGNVPHFETLRGSFPTIMPLYPRNFVSELQYEDLLELDERNLKKGVPKSIIQNLPVFSANQSHIGSQCSVRTTFTYHYQLLLDLPRKFHSRM